MFRRGEGSLTTCGSGLHGRSGRVPDSPITRSQPHRSIPENPFVLGVRGFRAALTRAEGGALFGALLPITVFLVVKATGGPGLASWDGALAVSGRDEATCLPLSGLGSGSGGEGQLSVLFEDVGRNTINEMDSKGQSIRAGVDLVSEPPGS